MKYSLNTDRLPEIQKNSGGSTGKTLAPTKWGSLARRLVL